MFPETKYESETVQLARGDSVIFLSDGFCEAQNSEGEFFGMERVPEVCENSREKSPEETLQQLTEAVVSYWCNRMIEPRRSYGISGNSG
jgi:sigma-B regulation protein RsbU (phosphoserine phosphatase)